MVFALLGAMVAIAGGSYALRRVVAELDERRAGPEVPPAPAPPPHTGGYVPAPREEDGGDRRALDQ